MRGLTTKETTPTTAEGDSALVCGWPGIEAGGEVRSPCCERRSASRDADGEPLRYHYKLYRGFDEQAPAAEDQGDNHIFSIPGGLQPGPYTASVLVWDGKYQVPCTFHFVVPDFPRGEAGDCGPVGIMCPDDHDVEMNVLAIDAAIEAALAEDGTEYSLIVSHTGST